MKKEFVKDEVYHREAVAFNEQMALSAEAAARATENPRVRGWCITAGQRHRDHAHIHRVALDLMLQKNTVVTDEKEIEA